MQQNRRKNTRSVQDLPAEMLFGSQHFRGRTINVSIDGALICIDDNSTLPEQSLVGTQGQFWLILGERLIECRCAMIRTGGDRAAVQFIDIDFDDAMALKRLLEG